MLTHIPLVWGLGIWATWVSLMKSSAQDIGSTRSVKSVMITTPLTTLLLFLSYHRCGDKDQVFRNRSLQVNWGVHWSVAVISSRKVQPWSCVLCIVWYSSCWSRKLWNCVTALCITLCLPYIWAENWITTSVHSWCQNKQRKSCLTPLCLFIPTQPSSSDLKFKQLGDLGLNPHFLTAQLCGFGYMIYPVSSSVKGKW